MSAKKVPFGGGRAVRHADADAWVGSAQPGEPAPAGRPPAEPMKRLTIDIPESLHRTIKSQCAQRGTKMADEIRALLIREYRNTD